MMELADLYKLFLASEGITTDTRNLKKGALFFALKGPNFNGNRFAEEAISAGCKLALVDEPDFANGDTIIAVPSVLKTLQQLANHHRNQFDIPIIGITGSNGKTTTKELAGAVLAKKYKTLVTSGNFNNHLGVPFTLFNLTAAHELAIIEMGANKLGDIEELVNIAEPTHGIISNVGAAHIEGFGSLAGVIKTKTEMYTFISSNEGAIFINADDEILNKHLPQNVSVYSYGEQNGDIKGELIGQNPFVEFRWKTAQYTSPKLTTQLVGRYNFVNFMSAIAMGVYFDVDKEAINEAIMGYSPSNNRSQVTKTDRNTLVVDCYNANATSMMAALESFNEMDAKGKICILGDMLELGSISGVEHQKIVDFVEANKLSAIFVGTEMGKTKTNLPKYTSWEEVQANENLTEWKDRLVLLKGSRGIRLEELIQSL